jgi:hypothetical protein
MAANDGIVKERAAVAEKARVGQPITGGIPSLHLVHLHELHATTVPSTPPGRPP